MSSILLVTYSGSLNVPSCLALDNGLANLAGALKTNGHAVRIEDLNTADIMQRIAREPLENIYFDFIEKTARDIDAQYIGFKCWASDGILAIRLWCALIRKRLPHVKILLGGPCCQLAPEATAALIPDFDFLFVHEAEKSLPMLVSCVDTGRDPSSVPGIMYRRSGAMVSTPCKLMPSLDELPAPDYSPAVYPAAHTGDKLNMAVLDESRGCPMGCPFCVHPSYAGSWRIKSVPGLVAEIKYIQSTLGTRWFRLAGSNTPVFWLREFASTVIREKIQMRFSCFSHTALMQPEDLPLLYKAGLRSIFYGVESFDDGILQKNGKRAVTAARSEEVLRATIDNNIFTTASFIWPMPFETAQSTENTFGAIRRIFAGRKNATAQFLNPAPLPGTKWWNERAHYGFDLHMPDDRYMMEAMTKSVRHILPPELQETMPYTLNGKSLKQMGMELGARMKEMQNDGVLVNISDETALIAFGCGENPGTFREQFIKAYLSSDYAAIRAFTRTFNRRSRQTHPAPSLPDAQESILP